MFFIKKDKAVNILSGNMSGGDMSVQISNLTIDGGNVDIVGGNIYVDGKQIASVDDRKIVINIQAGTKIESINSDVALNIQGNVHGSVTAKTVNCNDVGGDVDAQGNVNCNDVGGNVKAGGNVNCDDVAGNVTANRVNRS